MDIDLRQIRHAAILAEHKSFVRAATLLGITQPALSRSIQNLERNLGTLLFDRLPQGVEPTDAGRMFLERAASLLAIADEFSSELGLTRGLRLGRVICGAGPYPAETLVADTAARFTQLYPGVQIDLRIRNWDELSRALQAREIDFFVGEMSTLERDVGFEMTPLRTQTLCFVARAGHPLAHQQSIGLKDILQYPLVAPARIPPRVLEPFLRNRELQLEKPGEMAFPAIECASFSVAKRILLASDAVSVMTPDAVKSDVAKGELVSLYAEPWLHTGYGIVRLKNRALTAAAKAFLDLLVELDAERRPNQDAAG